MTRSPGFLDYTKKNFIEQLGFLSLSVEPLPVLNGRQIHDAISTAQETLHSIKTRKLQAMDR
jgi:hypothetical protein